MIIAIDPGQFKSACILYDTDKRIPVAFGIFENLEALEWIEHNLCWPHPTPVICESIESFAMAVGKSTFETCYMIGEIRLLTRQKGHPFHFVSRREEKLYLCNSVRAKDPNIRQAVIDRYHGTGGGKTPQVGTKAKPGPLYGISTHLWSAMAVAITWSERRQIEQEQEVVIRCTGRER